MNLADLDFEYPEHLVATERWPESRVMVVEVENRADAQLQVSEPRELKSKDEIESLFRAGDLLVINDTRVLSRRVFADSGLEILFLGPITDPVTESETVTGSGAGTISQGKPLTLWHVLCPSTRWKNGTTQTLPDGVTLELVARGRPQTVRSSQPLTDEYFERVGEMPLPPYIQQARGERHNRADDKSKYQTAWAEKNGSLAAPTASLHFSNEEIHRLEKKGVQVARVTLHVGLGTFLPVTVEKLDDHVMHAEVAEIPKATVELVEQAQARKTRVWALGTTVARTLESAALGKFGPKNPDGSYRGETDLFIRPGYEYKVVSALMTNFHQPKSTLLALVGAFAGLENVKQAYRWAMEKEFRLFSYGDLSVWIRR